MLVLNHSLLNREYILINVLKALTSIVSLCNLHGNWSSLYSLGTTRTETQLPTVLPL
jgi:hypothetical protein